MQIRKMTEADVLQVAAIERVSIENPWSKKGFSDALLLDNTCYLAAEEQGEIIGYCGYYRSFEEADIVNVAVAPAYRRRQIGRRLLQSLISYGISQGVTAFTLEVRVSNTPAIALYESLGFRTEAVRRRFYQNPEEDACLMWKRTEAAGSRFSENAKNGSNSQ